jgi:CBS domain-containing protein
MLRCDCGAIPVVRDAESMKPIGMITDRDIVIRLVAQGIDPREVRAVEAMSTDLATLRADADIQQAIDLMEERKIRSMPVVDADGRCVGMIARADIAERLRPEQAGLMLSDISQPGRELGSQGVYH